jgi:predicted nucleic acid-binding protein
MPTLRIVVTDANVLINLIHAEALMLLGRLPGHEFVVADEVVAEVTAAEQARALASALAEGVLRRESLVGVEALTLFAELTRVMGRGEAASLALAVTRRWLVASDEKRVFRREAQARLGAGRLLTTPGVLVLAIRAGLLSVEEADGIKALLESKRFGMTFVSFRDVL